MALQKSTSAYFSATGTTAKILSAIENGVGANEKQTIDLAVPNQEAIVIPNNELAIFGVPVFSGRVPEMALNAMAQIRGNNTPAIVVCVYGNRDFDDALLELKNRVEENGFYVIAAGAFVAQHSIFPQVAQGRPDASDLMLAQTFGRNSIKNLAAAAANTPLKVRGNHPYRATKPIPLTPKTDRRCNACGVCAMQCPVQAIDGDNPKRIEKSKCICCAHCISICPTHSKKFGGLLYWVASKKFKKENAQRKEPYLIYR